MSRGELSFESLVELIGEAAANRLSEERGGRNVFVPNRPGPGSVLTQIVGMDAATAMSHPYGGNSLTIPVGPGKRSRIRSLLDQGLTVASIARDCRCTMRHVYKIKAEAPAAPAEIPPLLERMGGR